MNSVAKSSADFHALVWGVRRSIRYHSHRRAYYDKWNLVASAMGVIMGSAAIGTALQKLPAEVVLALGALTTMISAFNLIIGSAKMARLHQDLVRQFSTLEADCMRAEANPEPELVKLRCERLRIEAEEPPKLAVLDVICHNELVVAEGRPSQYLARVGVVQRFLAPFFDFRAYKLLTQANEPTNAAPLAAPPRA